MCILRAGEVDCKEIGDCVHMSGYSSTDLCLPALDYLRRCSQVGRKVGLKANDLNVSNLSVREFNTCIYNNKDKHLCCNDAVFEPQLLTEIYKMPSKPVFQGARLASLPVETQERSMSTEDGMDCVLQEFDDGTGEFFLCVLASALAFLTVFSILQV